MDSEVSLVLSWALPSLYSVVVPYWALPWEQQKSLYQGEARALASIDIAVPTPSKGLAPQTTRKVTPHGYEYYYNNTVVVLQQ